MPAGVTNFNALPIELFLEQQLEVFKIQAEQIPDYVADLFDMQATSLYRETFLSRPGLTNFDRWGMEEEVGTEKLQTSYEVVVEQIAWRKQVAYTYKMKTYLQYRDLITGLTNDLAVSAKSSWNSYGVGWLMNQLFHVGNVWCADENKYLFATDHPLVTGGTASNLTTAALTPSSLSAGIVALMTQVDPMGRRMHRGQMNLELWFHDGDIDTVQSTLNFGGKYESGAANFNVNWFEGDSRTRNFSITPRPCEDITDNAWILKLPKDKCYLKGRESIPMKSKQYERNSDMATIHDAHYAKNVCATDWRGLYGSTGTA